MKCAGLDTVPSGKFACTPCELWHEKGSFRDAFKRGDDKWRSLRIHRTKKDETPREVAIGNKCGLKNLLRMNRWRYGSSLKANSKLIPGTGIVHVTPDKKPRDQVLQMSMIPIEGKDRKVVKKSKRTKDNNAVSDKRGNAKKKSLKKRRRK